MAPPQAMRFLFLLPVTIQPDGGRPQTTHFLLLLALFAFGLRAGGWVFPPLAVARYGLFVDPANAWSEWDPGTAGPPLAYSIATGRVVP